MANNNDRLVVAYFSNKAAAEGAVDSIKSWDKADDDVKLGAIAVPLFTLFGPEALAFRLENSGARALISNRAGLEKVAGIKDELPGLEVILSADGAAPGAADLAAEMARASEARPWASRGPGRVMGGNVQRFEVVPVALDLGALRDRGPLGSDHGADRPLLPERTRGPGAPGDAQNPVCALGRRLCGHLSPGGRGTAGDRPQAPNVTISTFSWPVKRFTTRARTNRVEIPLQD